MVADLTSRPTRVLILSTRPDPGTGGVATALAGFMATLDGLKIPWRFIATHHTQSLLGKVLPWLAAIPRLLAVLCTDRPTVAWLHSGAAPSMARLGVLAVLCRGFGVPVLWHLHDPTVDHWVATPIRRGLFRLMCIGATRFAVLTPWWERRLREAGIDTPLVILPNVLDATQAKQAAEPAAPGASGSGCSVLTCCRLVEGKGVDRLLRALATCSNEIHLVVAGDGPQRRQLESLAAQLEITSRVTFTGWLGPDELAERRDQADLFALLSTHDSFGMAYLEAMASGLPVLGSDWQAIPDVVPAGEAGLLVDPCNDVLIAEALQRLASDEDLRRRLGEHGRNLVREHWSPAARGAVLRNALETTR